MSSARWHHTPRPSALLLLLPAVGLLAGVWASTLLARSSRQYMNALAGSNDLLGPILVRVLAGLAIGVALAVAVALIHRTYHRTPSQVRSRFLHSPGWSRRGRRDVNSPTAVSKKLTYLLPSNPHARVEDASVPLGRDARGRPVLLACDESILVIGPPGSGKDRRVAMPLLERWPGAALVTSTKTDLALATMAARAERGPVAVFDPAGFGLDSSATAGGHGTRALCWNPIAGCGDKDVAARRAAAIIAGGTAGSMSEQFWAVSATRVLRACLHAAALETASVIEACEWATSVAGWIDASELMRAYGERKWSRELRDDADLDPRTSSSIVATLTGTLIGMSNTRLQNALDPGWEEDLVDLPSLLAASGTIFAVAPAEPDSHLVFRPWTTLLASEVAAVLRERAHGARLEPPALLLLNELVHVCPLPELPGLLADGRGHNIATVAIVQDPAQLAARYSPDEADAISAAAQHRLLLSAGADDTAREWSELIGNYRRAGVTRQHKAMGLTATGSSTSLDDTPIMPANELRHLPYGCAVMLPRGAPAMPISLAGH